MLFLGSFSFLFVLSYSGLVLSLFWSLVVCFLMRETKNVNLGAGRGGKDDLAGVRKRNHNQNVLYSKFCFQ